MMVDAPSYDWDEQDSAEEVLLTEDSAEELMNMLNTMGG
jgi:hypothetical protein